MNLDVENGRFDMSARLLTEDVRATDQVLRDILDGNYHKFKQEIIAANRQEIRGWLSDVFEEKFITAVGSLLDQQRLETIRCNEIDRGQELNLDGQLPADEDEGHGDNDLTCDQRFGPASSRSEDSDDRLYTGRSTTVVRTIIGNFVFTSLRTSACRKVRFISFPSAFISRGLEINYTTQSDSRGYLLIKDGGLSTYGLFGDEEPIYEAVALNNVSAVQQALTEKVVSISDRHVGTGMTILHVSKCNHSEADVPRWKMLKWK